MEFRTAMADFLQRDVATPTIEAYRKDLADFANRVGKLCLADITRQDVYAYIEALRLHRKANGDLLSDHTIYRRFRSLRTFFRWCVDEGYLHVSPADRVKVRKPHRDPYTSKAAAAEVLTNAVNQCAANGNRKHLATLLFLIDTGIRVGGCASLTLANLNLLNHCATVRNKGGGTYPVWFGQETACALENWLKERPLRDNDMRVFQLSINGIQSFLRRLGFQIGLDYCLSPHAIRHRVLQAWADLGINPKLVALKGGHRGDIRTVIEHYFNQTYDMVHEVDVELPLVALQKTTTGGRLREHVSLADRLFQGALLRK